MDVNLDTSESECLDIPEEREIEAKLNKKYEAETDETQELIDQTLESIAEKITDNRALELVNSVLVLEIR